MQPGPGPYALPCRDHLCRGCRLPHQPVGRPRPVRVLIVLRISCLTDESTSLERQLADARGYIAGKVADGCDWVEVGVARDAHVSATKQHPLDRAELGHWLKERAPEFDLVLFWKLDRFIRKVTDMKDMLRWADDHGRKSFASVTEPIFDLTGPFQHAIITLFSALAASSGAGREACRLTASRSAEGRAEPRISARTRTR